MTLTRSTPYFPVPDVDDAATHYEKVLGFHREYSAGTPPIFAILSRDGFGVMLRIVSDATRIVPNERQGGTWDAFFWTTDVLALHAELLARGADIVYGPIFQRDYAMMEFAVRDSNGYVLGFGQPWSE